MGATGPQGLQGIQGIQGEKGATGSSPDMIEAYITGASASALMVGANWNGEKFTGTITNTLMGQRYYDGDGYMYEAIDDNDWIRYELQGAPSYTAGNGIDITSNTVSAKIDNASIVFNGSNQLEAKNLIPILSTGAINYDRPRIYETDAIPSTGNITDSNTNAVFGVLQKIYHEDSSEPTYPASWTCIGGEYVEDELNIIYVEYLSNSRKEYWIIQEK